MNILKRLFCKHNYQLLTSYKKDLDVGVGYKMEEVYLCYCPKCCDKKEMKKHEYESEIKKWEIDNAYKQSKRNRSN